MKQFKRYNRNNKDDIRLTAKKQRYGFIIKFRIRKLIWVTDNDRVRDILK